MSPIDTSMLAFPKASKLRVEVKREKRLDDASQEREARAFVKKRDKGKCVIPGCKEAGQHLHHVTPRSRSKKHRWFTSNLCLLCQGHHGMVHGGRITISGDANVHLDIKGSKKDLAFRL